MPGVTGERLKVMLRLGENILAWKFRLGKFIFEHAYYKKLSVN
jgi:hypothetical protein